MFRISLMIFAVFSIGCGGASGKAPKKVQGGEGQVCFSDGSCNTNLFCVEGVCRATPPDNSTPNNVTPNNVTPNNVNPNNVNPNNQSFCNDGVLDPGELCDGANLNNRTCADLQFDSGTLRCSASCTFDTSGCSTTTQPVCGNGVLEAGEICDGANLQNFDCASQGFAGGTLRCGSDCTFFDTSSCSANACGNNVIEAGEVCDGTNLGDQTCEDRGFNGGTLRCNSACAAFDTSSCTTCGNNAVEGSEVCDGTNVNGQTCESLGFEAGTLGCNAGCTNYDVTQCAAGDLVCVITMPPAGEAPPCNVNDPVACLCEGCVDDGVCIDLAAGLVDDCVCADCLNDASCTDPIFMMGNCTDDGQCNPYVENCKCADCAAHPECLNP